MTTQIEFSKVEERRLVERLLAGEQPAFDEFFHAYAGRLAAFAARRSRLDAASVEDIVQNSLIKACRNLAKFRGESALLTWLCEICRREIIDLHRKSERIPAHDSITSETMQREILQLRAPSELEPELRLEAASMRSRVTASMNALPERYSRALELKYADGFSVEDIARIMDLSVAAAQSLLQRAREAFRQRWGKPRTS